VRSWESRVLPSADRLHRLGAIKHDNSLPRVEHIEDYLGGIAVDEEPEDGDELEQLGGEEG